MTIKEIEEGIVEGKTELKSQEAAEAEARRIREQNRLSPLFNTAVQNMIKGLESLQNMPGSTFKYSVNQQWNEMFKDIFTIDTNIPVVLAATLTISVHSNGMINASGAEEFAVKGITTEKGNVSPIIKFVAKKAALNGLIR